MYIDFEAFTDRGWIYGLDEFRHFDELITEEEQFKDDDGVYYAFSRDRYNNELDLIRVNNHIFLEDDSFISIDGYTLNKKTNLFKFDDYTIKSLPINDGNEVIYLREDNGSRAVTTIRRGGEGSESIYQEEFDFECNGDVDKEYHCVMKNIDKPLDYGAFEYEVTIKLYNNKDGKRIVRFDAEKNPLDFFEWTGNCECYDPNNCEEEYRAATAFSRDDPRRYVEFFTEYDEDGKHFVRFNDNVLVTYTDENGRLVVTLNGCAFSEYTENERHVIKFNNNELVSYKEDDNRIISLNGLKSYYNPKNGHTFYNIFGKEYLYGVELQTINGNRVAAGQPEGRSAYIFFVNDTLIKVNETSDEPGIRTISFNGYKITTSESDRSISFNGFRVGEGSLDAKQGEKFEMVRQYADVSVTRAPVRDFPGEEQSDDWCIVDCDGHHFAEYNKDGVHIIRFDDNRFVEYHEDESLIVCYNEKDFCCYNDNKIRFNGNIYEFWANEAYIF